MLFFNTRKCRKAAIAKEQGPRVNCLTPCPMKSHPEHTCPLWASFPPSLTIITCSCPCTDCFNFLRNIFGFLSLPFFLFWGCPFDSSADFAGPRGSGLHTRGAGRACAAVASGPPPGARPRLSSAACRLRGYGGRRCATRVPGPAAGGQDPPCLLQRRFSGHCCPEFKTAWVSGASSPGFGEERGQNIGPMMAAAVAQPASPVGSLRPLLAGCCPRLPSRKAMGVGLFFARVSPYS